MLTAVMISAALQAALQPDLSWMSGSWLACDPGREVVEVWTGPRGGLMLGMTLTVNDGRAGFEQSRIAPQGPAPDAPLAYFAQPEGQAATAFTLIDSAPGRVVFEQAADDDFPKRIVYQREGDTLNARIEGRIDDEARSVEWRFRRSELNARCPG